MSIGQRVKEIREARGWSQGELAKRVQAQGAKLSQQNVANIEAGIVKQPKSIMQLAVALGVFPGWLVDGNGTRDMGDFAGPGYTGPPSLGSRTSETQPPALSTDPVPSTQLVQVRQVEGPPDVPVWASAEAGMDGAIILTPDPVDYIRRSERMLTVRNPFAFVVIGGSMSPAIEHGDQVVINPLLQPRPGVDCVFIQQRPDGTFLALVKRLRRQTADTWQVRQFDPKRDFDLAKKKWPRVHVVAEIRRGGL